MKLIQEIGPFFALEVYIKVVFEQKNPPSTQKSTPKFPPPLYFPSTFTDFAFFTPPLRLFQPPRLLER